MNQEISEQFIRSHTPYFALALMKDAPKIVYLGIESGGRSWRFLDVNLLQSGFGGEILPGKCLQFSNENDAELS